MSNTELLGIYELQKFMNEFGKLPSKIVSKATRKGILIAYKAAESIAPIKTGRLRMGLKIVAERTKIPGKKVYQLTFSKSMNKYFVKVTKDGKRYYYPASQEYGFITKDGGYVGGHHYLRRSIEENAQKIESVIINALNDEIDLLG